MATIFVAKDGIDSNAGSKAAPKLTIAGAKAIAVDGDQIVLLDAYGEWFEAHAGGAMTFGIASAVLGLDIKSWNPARPARIGGVSGAASIQILDNHVRFHALALCTGADENVAIVQATALSKSGVEIYDCSLEFLHDLDTVAGYAVNCSHAGLVVQDSQIKPSTRAVSGFFLNGDGSRIHRVTANMRPRYDSGTAGTAGLRIHSGARDIECHDCEFLGAWGIRQSAQIGAASTFRFSNVVAAGYGAAAAEFIGAATGTLDLITRNCTWLGTTGLAFGGSNVTHNESGNRRYDIAGMSGQYAERDLLEADQRLQLQGGRYVLNTYRRGTTTELLPSKDALQPNGNDLTDAGTQLFAGYKEP